jgi:hypothetical protein
MEMEIEIGLRINQGSLSHTRECNHWQLMPDDAHSWHLPTPNRLKKQVIRTGSSVGEKKIACDDGRSRRGVT